ncbi:MAG: isoaspartyl peptidase/L-asparaginase family protein [Cyclobacteriaceae bacterium]
MKKIFITLYCTFIIIFQINAQKPVLVIHGGAGNIGNMSPAEENAYRQKLSEALQAGHSILENDGTSLEAVVAAVNIMEDSPLFNAGKGAVFTSEGKNELDASIMDGSNLQAGAVASVTTIKNPINAALAVMTSSPHVMLVGDGAEKFAREQGLEMVDPSYFYTEKRKEQLDRRLQREGSITDFHKWGTVGAVALDKNGNLAAATSTGGMTNKQYGRVGDSPIIGAGTYAENESCAVSATGQGEYFIRGMISYEVAALMKYNKYSLEKAAKHAIHKKLQKMGGEGGIISLDRKGNIAVEFNTLGMFRAWKKEGEKAEVYFYTD